MARPTRTYEGLVLKQTKLKEIDSIITLLMSNGTKTTVVARGHRKPGSRFGGRLNQFSVIQAFCTQGAKLDTINEARLIHPHDRLSSSALELTYAAYVICDLANRISCEDLAEPYLYQMTLRALSCLNELADNDYTTVRAGLIAAGYLIKAMALMGWHPSIETCAACGKPLEISTNQPQSTWWFNAQEGGCLCPHCLSAPGDLRPLATNLLLWLRFLIDTPFDTIARQTASTAVVLDLLDLNSVWICAQLDVSLGSLQALHSLITSDL